jgi:hypothetical protein
MTREEALKEYCSEYRGARLVAKLSVADIAEIVQFCKNYEALEHLDFEYKVNRMHLHVANRSKNWTLIQEVLSCVNTRARGKKRSPTFVHRTCSCCNEKHLMIPENAKHQNDGDELAGWYWECKCGTTLFVPEKEITLK